MPRLEGCLHGLKADPSARADDQDYRHGVMLPLGSAWLTVMCDLGNRTARWGGLKRVSKAIAVNAFPKPLRSHAARLMGANGLVVSRNARELNEGSIGRDATLEGAIVYRMGNMGSKR
jgi:hypothetical protein